jgi:epoxyqueuosine reductase
MNLAQDIKDKAVELGFDLVGITDASPIEPEQTRFLADWLSCGYAGRMTYMHGNFEKRINPAKLLQAAQSVIVVGLNHKPPEQTVTSPDSATPTGKVAHYARYHDYHLFMRARLRVLADFIARLADKNPRYKICVDSVPLAERALAARAGLGFIGRNHMLISPHLGPQIFLGEIVTALKLSPDEPIQQSCSNCNRCIAACPTGALRADGQFDANKCLSYLTIEYKGRIDPELAEKTGDRIFGCDECVLACPHHRMAPPCKNTQFRYHPDRARIELRKILRMTAPSFDAEFADSPIKRAGLDNLKRNAQICLDNLIQNSP